MCVSQTWTCLNHGHLPKQLTGKKLRVASGTQSRQISVHKRSSNVESRSYSLVISTECEKPPRIFTVCSMGRMQYTTVLLHANAAGNVFGRVCLCMCVCSVRALTLESLDLETSLLVCRCTPNMRQDNVCAFIARLVIFVLLQSNRHCNNRNTPSRWSDTVSSHLQQVWFAWQFPTNITKIAVTRCHILG